MDKIHPHFLGIGAQKAGTTWLWANLGTHPDIWMPPVKELHYFTRSPDYPSPNWLASEGIRARFFGQEPRNQFMRQWFQTRLKNHLPIPDLAVLRWEMRYFFGHYNDDWYISLFESGAGKVTGEISPAYSILNAEDIGQIKALFPHLKVIFLLRNPIDRAWSQIRFDKAYEESLASIVAFVNGKHQSLRSDYMRIIQNWRAAFPEDQLYIGFYEDVQHNPQKLLNELCDFLEIGHAEIDQNQLSTRIHTSAQSEIPPEVELFLIQKYLPQLEALSEMLGQHVTTWYEEAKNRQAFLAKNVELPLSLLEQTAASDQRWSDWASHRWQRRGLPQW